MLAECFAGCLCWKHVVVVVVVVVDFVCCRHLLLLLHVGSVHQRTGSVCFLTWRHKRQLNLALSVISWFSFECFVSSSRPLWLHLVIFVFHDCYFVVLIWLSVPVQVLDCKDSSSKLPVMCWWPYSVSLLLLLMLLSCQPVGSSCRRCNAVRRQTACKDEEVQQVQHIRYVTHRTLHNAYVKYCWWHTDAGECMCMLMMLLTEAVVRLTVRGCCCRHTSVVMVTSHPAIIAVLLPNCYNMASLCQLGL